ncbi:Predicted permease superfamily [Verrucomicrobiia bacterium DG1235]|nr:Predicted permease superfamily [Verrucomicrobiae bacterium DG1235]
MNTKRETKIFLLLAAAFLGFYFLPVGQPRFDAAINEALQLTKWYAREHVVLCLLPAFWIAGGIAAFVSQASVMRYLGPKASKPLAYGVGSVSGTILAVCSCTVLPLFAGIYRMGAGLGPAAAFLYSGPAINALAIILTAKVLGLQLGLARAIGAIVFSIVIGLAMAWLFRKEEKQKAAKAAQLPDPEATRPLWQTATFFATMVGILVFANWGGDPDGAGFFSTVHNVKWLLVAALASVFALQLWHWYTLPITKLSLVAAAILATVLLVPAQPMWPFLVGTLGLAWITAGAEGEAGEWFSQTWTYTKQIMPLLLGGVLVAGLLLGRPGHEGLIPVNWISQSVGGNSLGSNAFASVAGSLMYFATLTEVPILQGLLGSGMGSGPALALLLAGPALSLPNMIVINTIIGPKKTAAYVALVVVMATLSGWAYGTFFAA